MKYRYEKFIQLVNKENINIDTIKECLNCSNEEAFMLFNDLERVGAIKDGKVISDRTFELCARDRMIYDMLGAIEHPLHQIIELGLVNDDRFVKMIQDKLDPTFTTDLSYKEKERHLRCLFGNTGRCYLLDMMAGKFIYEIMKESIELALGDPYWRDRAKDI